MSTTFQVYPGAPAIPSFQEVLDRSNEEISHFLASVHIQACPELEVRVQRQRDDRAIETNLASPFTWGDDAYAWLFVDGIAGGTDAYFSPTDEVTLECWADLSRPPRARLHGGLIRKCLAIGHFWTFRRSAGQPAIINVAYGLIAGCLAELTSGFVSSSDSAWDWERMPALPGEFLSWYFRPELAIEPNFQEWSHRCIEFLRTELGVE